MEQQMQEPQVGGQLAARRKGAIRLCLGLLGLAVMTFVAVITITVLIPDENDYAKATTLKHERLASIAGRKVVLVGGSNLAFGLESDVIERETSCPTVNMGMNGYFGPVYMLSEVRPHLNSGDIVVLAFEWDNYAKSINGSGMNLLAIAKADPSVLAYFSAEQMRLAALAAPFVAQTKILRVTRDRLEKLRSLEVDDGSGSSANIHEIESLRSFDSQGDLNGHEGVTWDAEFEQGIDLSANGLNLEIIKLIKEFAQDMEARDVTVVMSYTPTMRDYYETQSEVIQEAHRQLTSGPDAVFAPRPPEDFVFDSSYFFDTVYHLKTTTRDERSQMVADDIQAALGAKPDCRINNP